MFQAARDMAVEVFAGEVRIEAPPNEARDLRLATRGLAARGLPELELVGIPGSLLHEAALLLNLCADAVVSDNPKGRESTWASRVAPRLFVAARSCVGWSTPGGLPTCAFWMS